ncbi:MAG: ThiF family adenylyltransferase [Clostridiales Family XIII bacterium]|jgi:adenylyltransferase/sulfurtransferase|nr:ThiF family adenylyltransferase [Clostridiales Family XIII bacterium]
MDKEQQERYRRQTAFPQIGIAGQEKLLASKAAILGVGALGSIVAERLARAGIGYLRLVDRDYVDLANLHRQTLYTETDADSQLPKAVAAAAHISAINSSVSVEPIVADISARNIETLIDGMDIVLDGSDNFELRALVGEACHKHSIPWVYGGAIGASGASMNILPSAGPCFRCIIPQIPEAGSYPTCATEGIIGMAASVVASIQSAEAIKLLIGSGDASRQYISIDLWNNAFDLVSIEKDPDCPVCGRHEYLMLEAGEPDGRVDPLCATGSYQVTPSSQVEIDIAAFADRLSAIGFVAHNPYLLRFDSGDISFNLFKDGRAVIRNARDEGEARTVYSEFIGL